MNQEQVDALARNTREEGYDVDHVVYVRVKNNFREVLFRCPICGFHLQVEAGSWNVGCKHYNVAYPGGLVGYHPAEGEWEPAGLFDELAEKIETEA